MKLKRLLRFYFAAEGLNETLDELIYACALSAIEGSKPCNYYAEKACSLVAAKGELCGLYGYLDDVVSGFTAEDIRSLKSYAFCRCPNDLNAGERRELHRAAVKFSRRIVNFPPRFSTARRIIGEYYCLLRPG